MPIELPHEPLHMRERERSVPYHRERRDKAESEGEGRQALAGIKWAVLSSSHNGVLTVLRGRELYRLPSLHTNKRQQWPFFYYNMSSQPNCMISTSMECSHLPLHVYHNINLQIPFPMMLWTKNCQ